jgi:NadR type nicotinamide-nucleotide adenylyltransferase
MKGLVIGKFYPFHTGHQYVIDTALKNSNQVTAIVTGKKGQIIPANIRASWIKQIYPQVDVKLIYHDIPDDNDEAWAKNTIKWLGFKPNLVFTSEKYGDHYSKLMGAKHIAVDIPRKKFPISGTKIREKPHFYPQYLHPIVRAYFVKRVCFVGAESTGTTTMAQELAKLYKTSWVPEFGRYYSEGKKPSGSKWENSEFVHIAKFQNSFEDELAKYSNKVLFCDTNSLVTYVWQEFFLGEGTKEVENLFKRRKYSLYIITDMDIPYIQDSVRIGKRRKWMHDRLIEILKTHNQPYIVVSGHLKKRIAFSKSNIDEIIKNYKIEEQVL